MNAHYDAHGFPGGNALVLRAVQGREPRTLAQYFAELAGAAPASTVPPGDGTRALALADPDDPALRHLGVVGDTAAATRPGATR